jgi:hypothetical protein
VSSVAAALAGLTAALAVGSARAARPPLPPRLVALVDPAGGRRTPTLSPVARVLGARLRRVAGRACDPRADERWGRAVLAAVAGAVLHPAVGVAAALAVWATPWIRAVRAERARRERVRDGVPDLVDLFRLAAAAGLPVRLAVEAVAERAEPPLRAPLEEVCRRVRLGERLVDALAVLAEAGDPLRPLTAALVQAERDGVPLTASLGRIAGDARRHRRRAAEERARRLPVRLLFPLVACILPAFVLLTLVPLLGATVRSVRL